MSITPSLLLTPLPQSSTAIRGVEGGGTATQRPENKPIPVEAMVPGVPTEIELGKPKPKRAKYGWRKTGGSGFVRKLTTAEYQHFRETAELPKVGNITSIVEGGFGWLWMQPSPDPDRPDVIAPQRRRRNGRWTLTTRLTKRFEALEKEAMIMVAHDRTLYTTDDAAKAGAEVIRRFNAVMQRRGLGARIEFKAADRFCLRELWPGAGMDALRILTGPDLYERGPDGWCGPFLEGLMLCLLNPQRENYSDLAKREWDKRLRQTKQGKAFKAAEAEQQVKDRQSDEELKAAHAERCEKAESEEWKQIFAQGGFGTFDPFRKR